MPFAGPSNAVVNGGKDDPEGIAAALFEQAGWMKRLCLEILAEDPALNLVKAFQLCFQCVEFRRLVDKYRDAGTGDVSEIIAAVGSLVRRRGTGNPNRTDAQINADLKSLYAAVVVFATFALANLPQFNTTVPNVTVTVLPQGTPPRPFPDAELRITAPLPAAFRNQVTTLRGELA